MLSNAINNLESDLAILTNYINIQQRTGFHSMERLLEVIIKKLFNIVYSYNLENRNILKMNFPAIDLADDKNKIAIQVTTNATPSKVNSTITKFEKLKMNQSYAKLYIVGFCKYSKIKGLKDCYEVIGIDHIMELLIEKNDENAIEDAINVIRQHVDYSSIHPYNDLDCLGILLNIIDRNAIKHRMSCEGSYKDMIMGFSEITEVISKGQLNGKEKSKSIDNFNDDEIVEFMRGIRDKISKILSVINKKRSSDYDFVCLSHDEMNEIDKIKEKIIVESNEIAKKKKLSISINRY